MYYEIMTGFSLTDLSLLTGTPRLLPSDAILKKQRTRLDAKLVAVHYGQCSSLLLLY